MNVNDYRVALEKDRTFTQALPHLAFISTMLTFKQELKHYNVLVQNILSIY